METIHVNLENVGGKELTIRQGKALEVLPKKQNIWSGLIDSPLQFLQKREDVLDLYACVVLVMRSELTIRLVTDESSQLRDEVFGTLYLSDKYKAFGINSGNYITPHEMAALIKMNRTAFENIDVAMRLVSQLQNFKAKVNKEVEAKKDDRANYSSHLSQVVDSNLPESFKLNIPIFKGQQKQLIEVEVYIRASDLNCCLMSTEANDVIETTRDAIIDDVLEKIKELAPSIVVIEQ